MEAISKLIEENEDLKTYIENEKLEAVKAAKNDKEEIGKYKAIGSKEAFIKASSTIMAKLGISKDEIKDFDSDIEKILEVGIEKIGKNKDLTAQELQKQLLEVKSEYETFKNVEVPKISSKYEQEFNRKVISAEIGKLIAKNQTDIIIPFETAEQVVSTILNTKYDLSLVNGKVDIRVKGEESLKPVYNNKVVEELNAIILEELKLNNLYKLSNGGATSNQGATSQKDELSENARRLQERMSGK